jgi:TonB family protein
MVALSSDYDSALAQSFHEPAAAEDSIKLRQLFEQGQTDAREDLSTGSPKYKWFTMGWEWLSLFEEMATERYGVQVEFGGDVVSTRDDAYWSGYNGVIHDSLSLVYGEDFMMNLYGEAVRDYRRVRPSGEAINPEVMRNVPFPEKAKAAGVTGRVLVLVEFDITPAGVTDSIEVTRSLDLNIEELTRYGFVEPAVAAVRKLRFEPAKDQEHAVSRKNRTWPVTFGHR